MPSAPARSAAPLAAGYPAAAKDPHAPPPVVYTADIFDPRIARPGCRKRHSRQLRLTRNDRSTRRARPGPAHLAGHQSRLRHGHSQKTNTGGEQSKHGIWHADVADCLRRADANGLAVTGLHMHIGSGTDLEHLRHVCQAMEKTARDVGRSVTNISAGGGLPRPLQGRPVLRRSACLPSSSGTKRANACKTPSAIKLLSKSNPADIWPLKPVT